MRVNYNTAVENPSFTDAYELADRYEGGLTIDLPGNWSAQVYYSQTYDSSFNHVTGVAQISRCEGLGRRPNSGVTNSDAG